MHELKIIGGRVVTPMRILENAEICLAGGKIASVGSYDPGTDALFRVVDAGGLFVAPGLIDIHAHGGGGHDFMDATPEAFLGAAEAHARHGTTCLVPTTLSAADKEIYEAFAAFRAARRKNVRGAEMPGLHLEGPYFADAQRGAQDPALIKIPNRAHWEKILDAGGRDILRWSAAPELPGALELGRALAARGILAAVGHSDATEDEMLAAYENGYTHVTHLYSCMSTIRRTGGYRVPGVLETARMVPEFTVEVIADGHHVPESLLRAVFREMGTARIALVTDAMRGAGMPEGDSVLGSLKNGKPCVIEGGVAKLPDRSAFAGSVATADLLVRNMIRLSGASLPEAVRMMTLTPARIMGFRNKGVLAPGRDADIALFDRDIRMEMTIVGGRIVYHRGGETD